MRNKFFCRGFTLVEILVAVSILAILATIGFNVYFRAQESARDGKRVADIKAIGQAYEANYNENSGYSKLTGTQFLGDSVPKSPNGDDYVFVQGPDTPDINKNCPGTVKICAVLENGETYCYSGLRVKSSCPEDPTALAILPSPVGTSTPYPTSSSSTSTSPSASPSPTPYTGPLYEARVFVTSTGYTGNLGGIDGANSKCQQVADSKGLGGTWKAWISESNATGTRAQAKSPSGEFNAHSDYRGYTRFILLNNQLVANSWSELTDGAIDNPIKINENGTTFDGSWGNIREVWSSTRGSGSAIDGTDTCSNWTSSDSGLNGNIGKLEVMNTPWTENITTRNKERCDREGRLYCFEQTCKVSSGITAEDIRIKGPESNSVFQAQSLSYKIACANPFATPSPTATPRPDGWTIGPITIPGIDIPFF